jgi:hypothetical protein
MDGRRNGRMVEAQDLKCGDKFIFRSAAYICLVNFIDSRHTQAIVTAILAHAKTANEVHCMRFFRTFSVEVIGKDTRKRLVVHNNDRTEIEGLPAPVMTRD